MEMITFTQPDMLIFLAGLPIIIFAHLASQKYAKTRALMFANFDAVKRVVGNRREITNIPRLSGNWFLLLFRIITYTVLVLAVAGTTMWMQGMATEQDFIIAIDASGSMLAQDIFPSRFEAAKSSGAFFIDTLEDTGSIGVIAFAGTPMILMPLTNDHTSAWQAVMDMEISRMSGTDIASTLMLSTNMLMSSERSKAIIMITDGRQTVATPLNPAIEYTMNNNVVVNVIGIGTADGGVFTEDGLITSIDIEALESIAGNTAGKLYIAQDEEGLERALREIADMKYGLVPFNAAYYLMLLAFIMLFMEWGLLNTVFRNLP
jgi:Ca-activated chloride channel homolog